ncbi:MAG: (2Fe-2S)-binding protein [Mobilicoccus sp.]|nr:(2Fe-2S)-binding protein [Mobilicoccus sp.]
MSSHPDLAALADDITTYVGYVDVVPDGWGTPLPYSCESIVTEQESGGDPTAWWREAVGRAQGRRYTTTAPPQVAAAFVLGWYLQVVAVPLAFAAVLRDWLPDASPAALRFDLDDREFYPVAQSLGGDTVQRVAQPQVRVGAAREAYEAHALRFADSYRPGVKMSSRQRYGLVRDTWAASLDQARTTVRGEPSRLGLRESCCFLFALPGAITCARCPRQRAR